MYARHNGCLVFSSRNLLSFMPLFMYLSCSFVTDFHRNVLLRFGQPACTKEMMFFSLQRALMFHSSSTYHYLEQTWLYVFAVALERFSHLHGYRQKSWTSLFLAECPPFSCECWLYACSTLLFHNLKRAFERFRPQGLHPRRAIFYSLSKPSVVSQFSLLPSEITGDF